MNLTETARKSLLALLEAGMDSSSEQLAKLSRTKWSMQTISMSTNPPDRFKAPLEGDTNDNYAITFTMPGGGFVVVFSKKSGATLAKAFLPAGGPPPGGRHDFEAETLAEVANVLVNAVAGVLADTCEMGFFVSAPQTTRGTKEDLYENAERSLAQKAGTLAILSYVHLSSAEISTDCSLVVVLNTDLARRILTALGE